MYVKYVFLMYFFLPILYSSIFSASPFFTSHLPHLSHLSGPLAHVIDLLSITLSSSLPASANYSEAQISLDSRRHSALCRFINETLNTLLPSLFPLLFPDVNWTQNRTNHTQSNYIQITLHSNLHYKKGSRKDKINPQKAKPFTVTIIS